MNEQSNDLLAAFENPDMVQEPVVNVAPEVNVAPAAPVMPEAPAAQPQTMVDPSAVMPQEFQNAPEPTPVETPVAQVTETPVVAPAAPVENVAPAAPVETAPEAPVAPTDNQNVMPNVSEDPVVSVSQEAKKERPKEDTPSIKKNLVFIIIFCVVIAAFIIFLPRIMELLGGSF